MTVDSSATMGAPKFSARAISGESVMFGFFMMA
jgi:hypothetical protein